MSFAISIVSVCPLRLEPSHRSEMVSQLLFGESVKVLDIQKDFTKVQCLFDGYEGWCQSSQLEAVNRPLETNQYLKRMSQTIGFEDTRIYVPFATPVYRDEAIEGAVMSGRRRVNYMALEEDIWDVSAEAITEEKIGWIANHFLNTPYLWGGKSVNGIDCSGFVQQVFKFFGVQLLRDAYLQAEQGEPVDHFHDVRFGDLAFFQNDGHKITHVGLLLNDKKIIHASGRVRVDELREDGIYNSGTGQRSHVIHSVRRVLPAADR